MRNSAQAASSGNSVWNWASERGRVMPPAYYLRFGSANLHMVGQSAYLGHLGKPWPFSINEAQSSSVSPVTMYRFQAVRLRVFNSSSSNVGSPYSVASKYHGLSF